MCDYKSGIVLRDESAKGGFKLLMSPWTESHSELEQIFKLQPDKRDNRAKVEFTPAKMEEAYKPETYSLRIDEDRCPNWFDAEMKTAVAERMRDYIKSIVVSGDVCLLIGGQFIIAPGAKVECAKAMVLSAVCGGTISEVRGGTISEVWGGTISEVRGGTISAVSGGTISEVYGGTISEVWGGTISEVRGGTISAVRGGTISAVWGGTISEVRGGTISAVRGGTISEVYGGTISEVWGGTISEVRGGTIQKILKCFDGILGKVTKPGKIQEDERK